MRSPMIIKHGNGWKPIPFMDDFPNMSTYIIFYTCMYIHKCIHIDIYTYMRTIFVYNNIYIYVYIHICILTCIYTHIEPHSNPFAWGFSEERRCFQSQLQALGVEPRGIGGSTSRSSNLEAS